MIPTDDRDDAAIVQASLRDPDQFAVIFDRHAPYVHRYLARRLGLQAADDLVAETFLVAFGKRKRYDHNRTDARPWLYGIATNLVGQHRRDEAKQLRLRNAISPEPDVASHAERVVAQVAAQAMGQLLGTALAELSTGDRDVLLLVAWEGLTYDQVAMALDIPVGTVRSRLNRARKQVREVLEVPQRKQKEIRTHG
ncbi:RNA polymerase sigma-70 factor (ECF subfamily) [Kibdelosporangium banguiense]|uniref:RNA polymerase sigma-70 factor (ECF subfamily) n=1 Tax=Kibdelosporangium banguiense TaxID=1365924 RepID=A0ABS4TK68_9PSEU|nr:RNA polymerase sigma factor [Kibdelosporangium banguiense]MBP2324384.1 RNA polymerase sigma-70 factor (ECF subfamily) [Kibdelosporangium banguiense]